MAEKHPYSPAGGGGITAAILQLRRSFPPKVTAETLKKLGIASNSESYVINVLRFVGIIDRDGVKTAEATAVFSKHNDAEFQQGFEGMVEKAYQELFSLHGDSAWELSTDSLIGFFRHTDQTSALTGRRQSSTFQTLASLAGHGEVQPPPKVKPAKDVKVKAEKPKPKARADKLPSPAGSAGMSGLERRDVGLTVRIEVNLPPAADQETYDRIFRSIRENLLNAK